MFILALSLPCAAQRHSPLTRTGPIETWSRYVSLIYYFLYTRIKENKSKETTPIITTSRIHPSLSVFTWSFGKDKEMDGAGCDNGRAVIYYKINNGSLIIIDILAQYLKE